MKAQDRYVPAQGPVPKQVRYHAYIRVAGYESNGLLKIGDAVQICRTERGALYGHRYHQSFVCVDLGEE